MLNERMRISMYMIQQSESFFVSLSAAKHYALVLWQCYKHAGRWLAITIAFGKGCDVAFKRPG